MNHIAAIHVLKTQLKLSEGDYRALLTELTGKDSCKAMHATQLAKVRSHLDNLAVRMGVAVAKPAFVPNAQFTRQRTAVKRSDSDAGDDRWLKARTLWAQLAQAGKVKVDTDAALLAYVKRQTQLEAWRFLNGYQINMIIESLKCWLVRADVKVKEVA
jgi:phage gp16-like protein